jgi:hypothetical protein
MHNIVVTWSNILDFHPEENSSFQNNTFNKVIPSYNQWRRDIGFHPKNRDSLLEEHRQECSPLVLTPPPANAGKLPNTC